MNLHFCLNVTNAMSKYTSLNSQKGLNNPNVSHDMNSLTLTLYTTFD